MGEHAQLKHPKITLTKHSIQSKSEKLKRHLHIKMDERSGGVNKS